MALGECFHGTVAAWQEVPAYSPNVACINTWTNCTHTTIRLTNLRPSPSRSRLRYDFCPTLCPPVEGCDDFPDWEPSGFMPSDCRNHVDYNYCNIDGSYGDAWNVSMYGTFAETANDVTKKDVTEACCGCGGGTKSGT